MNKHAILLRMEARNYFVRPWTMRAAADEIDRLETELRQTRELLESRERELGIK